jgi:hypothetical protein
MFVVYIIEIINSILNGSKDAKISQINIIQITLECQLVSSNCLMGVILDPLWIEWHSNLFCLFPQTKIKTVETLSLNNLLVKFRLCCFP